MKIKLLQNEPYLFVSWRDEKAVEKIAHINKKQLVAIQADLNLSICTSEKELTVIRKIDIESEIELQIKEFNSAIFTFTGWFINLKESREDEDESRKEKDENEEIKKLLKKIIAYVQTRL